MQDEDEFPDPRTHIFKGGAVPAAIGDRASAEPSGGGGVELGDLQRAFLISGSEFCGPKSKVLLTPLQNHTCRYPALQNAYVPSVNLGHHVCVCVQGHYGLQMSSGVERARAALLTASFLESCSTHSPSGHCPLGRAGRWGHGVPGAFLLYLTQEGAGCTEGVWVAEVGTKGGSCTWAWGRRGVWRQLCLVSIGEVGAGDGEVPPSLKGHFQGH